MRAGHPEPWVQHKLPSGAKSWMPREDHEALDALLADLANAKTAIDVHREAWLRVESERDVLRAERQQAIEVLRAVAALRRPGGWRAEEILPLAIAADELLKVLP